MRKLQQRNWNIRAKQDGIIHEKIIKKLGKERGKNKTKIVLKIGKEIVGNL